ncbi:MAG: RluA family pseudouridine synthase [Gemmataceae bacterium]|nr:RluA family pseudouridine synthase [Gemmataceae bacterium]
MDAPAATSEPGLEHVARLKVDGQRLDAYLVAYYGEATYSRSVLKRVIDAGGASVNGKPAKASCKVRHGDLIRLVPPEPPRDGPAAEDIPLDVLHEDEWLAVVNKPADMVVHPARGNWSGTLVNALRHRFPDLSGLNGDYRAGIVHRLDRDTSGVILVAKEEGTHKDLALLFEQRKVYKEYLALCAGVLDRDSDYVESRIAHHKRERVKMAIAGEDDEDAKDACTYYEVVERFRGFTFVRCVPKTGRTHQIRIHLASVGNPILADKLYSGRDRIRLSDLAPGVPEDEDELLLPRQALHAHRLRLKHPRTGVLLEAEAPLPPEMARTLEALRTHRPRYS